MRRAKVVEFDVRGKPEPQGSARAFLARGRPIVTTDNKSLRAWRDLVATVAQSHAPKVPMDGPVVVTLAFRLPRPKSAPKTRPVFATKRPDLDKLVRSVLDAITHVVIEDDAQVVEVRASKELANDPRAEKPKPPGVRVRIEAVGLLLVGLALPLIVLYDDLLGRVGR